MFADVASDGAGIGIVAAAGRVADDETDGLALVKVFRGGIGQSKRKSKCSRCRLGSGSFFHHRTSVDVVRFIFRTVFFLSGQNYPTKI